jgi:DNA repair protein RecN (Recombination protein N)
VLTRLLVRNFLLVEEGVLEFGPGFNALTGETGAGKSILLHALGLLLGARGSAEWIRRPAEGLLVEGVFRVDAGMRRRLQALGIADGGEELVVSREIRRSGTNRCFANGQRVLVERLRRLAEPLVEIHGQREEERFRHAPAQRDLLDLFGGHGELRQRVRSAYREAREAEEALAEHERTTERLEREQDWLRFQLAEFDRIRPAAGEEEALREALARQRDSAQKTELLALTEHILNGRDGAVLESLEELDHRAAAWKDAGEPWEGLRASIAELARQARGLHQAVRRFSSGAPETGGDAETLALRLSELEHLRRKHRRTLEEIVAQAETWRASLRELEEAQTTGADRRARRDRARQALEQAAASLGKARRKAGTGLADALHRELEAIGMGECRLAVRFEPLRAGEGGIAVDDGRAIGAAGGEGVDFQIETNPNEGFRPLGEIASGGEMARIALALRVVLGGRGRPGLSIFDEIDAGLGGSAARAVAARIAEVGRHRQVLLVTHLPLIAARAERQIKVAKETRAGRSRVTVAALEGEARVAEIARMLAGEGADPQAQQHARALLREPSGLPEPKGSGRN